MSTLLKDINVNSKTFGTFFFQVGDGVREIVAELVTYLRNEKLWGNDDPLFPTTRIALGSNCQFKTAGLTKKPWSNATPIRKIFKEAFTRAVCHISTHTLFAIPWFSWARKYVRLRRI